MAKCKEPLHSFIIKPTRYCSLHYKVNIWNSAKDMQEHTHWFRLGRKCRAACSTYSVYKMGRNKEPKLQPIMGEINLQKRHLGIEAISHECCHAALGYVRRKNLNLHEKIEGNVFNMSSAEEKMCYALGYFVKQIVNQLWKLKLWK